MWKVQENPSTSFLVSLFANKQTRKQTDKRQRFYNLKNNIFTNSANTNATSELQCSMLSMGVIYFVFRSVFNIITGTNPFSLTLPALYTVQILIFSTISQPVFLLQFLPLLSPIIGLVQSLSQSDTILCLNCMLCFCEKNFLPHFSCVLFPLTYVPFPQTPTKRRLSIF